MKSTLFLILCCCCNMYVIGQVNTGRISGTVYDNSQKPIEAATIRLLRANDQKWIKSAVTDLQGKFEMAGIAAGKYIVSITAVGFADKKSNAFEITAQGSVRQLPEILLDKTGKLLQEVTITGKKPMVENQIDKTVVNVDAFITTAGGTAMDVLEKSPGISVDRDGNISLKGKQGVIILVDGKQTFLGGQDLANLLKNMPANQLETVEIMTQPSAKFDASGNSGIINIKTKKNKQSGFSGSVNLSYIQGWYPKSPNSLNLNFKKNRINFFTNYSFSYWQGGSDLTILRKFRNAGGNVSSIFDQASLQGYIGKNQSLRMGMDYSLDKKTTIGIGINGMYNPRQNTSRSTSDIYNGKLLPDSTNTADTRNNDPWKNMGLNLNFRKQIDTAGRELTADVDYIRYASRNKQYSNNYTFNNLLHILSDSLLLRGDLPSDIKIYSAKIDYTHPLKQGAKLETGVKSSYVETNNNAKFTIFDNLNQKWETDANRSNHFIYRENILAAYMNYRRQLKKWGLQAGLRYEHTFAEGKQLINNNNFDRNYGQLFPSAYVSYEMTEKNRFGFSYGRRIQRPNYQDMNPFQYFLDQYTYSMGNPLLTPQFSHNLELSHNYKGQLNTAINYTVTTDIINEILKQNNETKVTFQTKENIAKRVNIGLSVSYNKPVTKWWTTSVFTNIFNNRFEGFVNNKVLKVNISTFLANMNNQFRFNKGWGAEFSGFYRSTIQEAGIIVARPMGVLSFGASKQVLNGKGTVKLNLTDPFYLQYFRGYTKFGDIDAEIANRWDNRRVGLSFTYRFGKMQNNPPARRRAGSSQDEQNRVGEGQQ